MLFIKDDYRPVITGYISGYHLSTDWRCYKDDYRPLLQVTSVVIISGLIGDIIYKDDYRQLLQVTSVVIISARDCLNLSVDVL